MQKRKIAFEAIGTQWSIETAEELPESSIAQIHERIEKFDATYSRFRQDSLVSRISKNEGIYVFPDDAIELFEFYEHLYDATSGKVTPLIGGALERAGYDADYSFQAKPRQPVPKLHDVIVRRGNTLEVKKPVTIDVGAAGKGYLVDLIAGLLDYAGIEEYIIDASGDMRHEGKMENNVGLEHPNDPTKVIGAIDVMNKSFCASASNRRRWGNGIHHIFDPDTLSPTNDIIATWVMADSAMVADGVATSLFFTDPEILQREYEYAFVRMHADGAIDYSPAFEGKLYL